MTPPRAPIACACVDVDYRTLGAVAACLWFADWGDAAPLGHTTTMLAEVVD